MASYKRCNDNINLYNQLKTCTSNSSQIFIHTIESTQNNSNHLVHSFVNFNNYFYFALSTQFSLSGFLVRYYHIILNWLMYSISFISWIISVNFCENIKTVRNRFNKNDSQIITANLLIEANKLISTSFVKIKQIDQYFAFGFFSLSVGIIFSTLKIVYLFVGSSQHFLFLRFLPFQLNQIILMVLNCIINGNVIEETMKLQCNLDNIDFNVNQNGQFYELM